MVRGRRKGSGGERGMGEGEGRRGKERRGRRGERGMEWKGREGRGERRGEAEKSAFELLSS